MKRLVILVPLIAAACSGASFVVLKNPQPGEVKECKSDTQGLSMIAETRAVADCARGYQALGYQRMN